MRDDRVPRVAVAARSATMRFIGFAFAQSCCSKPHVAENGDGLRKSFDREPIGDTAKGTGSQFSSYDRSRDNTHSALRDLDRDSMTADLVVCQSVVNVRV